MAIDTESDAEGAGAPGGAPADMPLPAPAPALEHAPPGLAAAQRGEPPRRRPGRPAGPAGHTQDGEIETRGHILQHARRLFMHRGFAGVAVGEVAAAVGVTKPTLYYHFGDKEGLYAAVLCDLMGEVGGHIRRVAEAERPLEERLVDLAHGYFLHADATMEPVLRDATELLGRRRAAAVWDCYEREMFAPIRRLMARAIERGEMRPGDADTYVRAFFGMLDGLTAPGGHGARDAAEHRRVAEALVGIFLEGAGRRA